MSEEQQYATAFGKPLTGTMVVGDHVVNLDHVDYMTRVLGDDGQPAERGVHVVLHGGYVLELPDLAFADLTAAIVEALSPRKSVRESIISPLGVPRALQQAWAEHNARMVAEGMPVATCNVTAFTAGWVAAVNAGATV